MWYKNKYHTEWKLLLWSVN